MVSSQQFVDSKYSSVKLAACDTELDTVVPDAPITAPFLQSLFRAGKRFFEFVLNAVAIGHVSPRIILGFINLNDVAKAEYGLIKLFKPHVGTAAREPFLWVEPVDFKCFVETLH